MCRFSYCTNCGYGASGYGFVATVQGNNPSVCPECQQETFKPVSKVGLLFRVFRDKFIKKNKNVKTSKKSK